MKNILSIFILVLGLLFSAALGTRALASQPEQASVSQLASVSTTADAGDLKIAFEQTSGDNVTSGSFFSNNWGALAIGLLTFFDVVARLTPTEKDNSIVNLLTTVINAIIPNFKKGGGRF